MERHLIFMDWKTEYCYDDNWWADSMQSLSVFHCLLKIETDKLILKLLWKSKRSSILKTILNKNKIRELTLTDFKFYYKVIVFKIMGYCFKDRYMDQWNKIESTEINPYIYGQLIFKKYAKTIKWEKE